MGGNCQIPGQLSVAVAESAAQGIGFRLGNKVELFFQVQFWTLRKGDCIQLGLSAEEKTLLEMVNL